MNYKYDISVIVPVYNVEEYLEECLDSLVNQTKDHIQIIIVDNNSQDSSAEISKKYAEKYENVEYYFTEKSGLGYARNYGFQFVEGKYIAYVDSDDKLDLDMYEKMYNLAEKNNSDLTICNVARFSSTKCWVSKLHNYIFDYKTTNTHIFEYPNFVYDTTSWNKLIKRSFYEENGFKWPEGILFEDIPVTIPMHVLANNVSIADSAFYYWRIREGVSKSITQNNDTYKNLLDRIKVLNMLDDFLEDPKNNVPQSVKDAQKNKILNIDMLITMDQSFKTDVEFTKGALKIVNEYIAEKINPKYFDSLDAIKKYKYQLAKDYDVDSLLRFTLFCNKSLESSIYFKEDNQYYTYFPKEFFADKVNITSYLKNTNPITRIAKVENLENAINVYFTAYIKKTEVKDENNQTVKAFLQNEQTMSLVPLNVEIIDDAKVLENLFDKGQVVVFDDSIKQSKTYDCSKACYKLTIDVDSIDFEKFSNSNRIILEIENSVYKKCIPLRSQNKIFKDNSLIIDDRYALFSYNNICGVKINFKKVDNFFESANVGSEVIIKMQKPVEKLYAHCVDDDKIVEFSNDNGAEYSANPKDFSTDKEYTILYTENGEIINVLSSTKQVFCKESDDASLIFLSNKNNRLRIISKNSVTKLKAIKKYKNNLVISTISNNKNTNKCKGACLYVRDDLAGKPQLIAKGICKSTNGKNHCVFYINFKSKNVTKNLYAGVKDLLIKYGNNDDYDLIYSDNFVKRDFNLETLFVRVYRALTGNLVLKSSLLWKEDENTAQKRKAMLNKCYEEYRKEPIDDKVIIFESMWGTKYSCNPRCLYEYIDENYPQYKCVWSMKDEHYPIKGNGIRVRRGSKEYYHYLATAKYLVNNVNFEDNYVKRDGQIEIQTMHGTPLKTMGLEVLEDFKNDLQKEKYIEKNNRWNYLVVQGRFMQDKAYDCFRYDKAILETGYPRTDGLFNADDEKLVALKKELGLPLDKKIILYAPTWRIKRSFDMQLDLDLMKKYLKDEYIVITKLHHLCRPNNIVNVDNKFSFDFGNYQNIEDLYLISDIMITDYSSTMFDYALLNKPMIFYTYDLEDYRDNLRGMYFDIEKEAPGPIVFNTKQVVNSIINIEEQLLSCKERIDAFTNKYVNYECSNSSEMIVQEVLKPSKKPLLSIRLLEKSANKK